MNLSNCLCKAFSSDAMLSYYLNVMNSIICSFENFLSCVGNRNMIIRSGFIYTHLTSFHLGVMLIPRSKTYFWEWQIKSSFYLQALHRYQRLYKQISSTCWTLINGVIRKEWPRKSITEMGTMAWGVLICPSKAYFHSSDRKAGHAVSVWLAHIWILRLCLQLLPPDGLGFDALV